MVLALLSATAWADEGVPAPVSTASQPAAPDLAAERYEGAKRLRDAGMATTISGLTLGLAGGVMFAVGDARQNGTNDEDPFGTAALLIMGPVLMIGGGTMLLAGPPMWGVGQAQMNRNKPVGLSLMPSVGADGAGMTVVGRF